jgi:putative chitinase
MSSALIDLKDRVGRTSFGSGLDAIGMFDAALQAVAPQLARADHADWIATLAERMGRAGMTGPRRIAAFLGQCAVESAGFRSLEENLNYSSARLCTIWPNRFPSVESAKLCAFRPLVLANTVYANRMGNGDPASGDGWRFRGRGLIQITGRTAYERFARSMSLTLDQAVAHAVTRAGAVDSAMWFWRDNDLDRLADAWLLDPMTRKISGGMTGATERRRLCQAALGAAGG